MSAPDRYFVLLFIPGVMNRDDDFPTDASCSVRDQNHCTGYGVGCDDDREIGVGVVRLSVQ